jgi:SET family sugar efflux transporter-like MFS transporter
VAAVLLLGIADSMANSFMVLFAANEAELSPFQVGLFVSAAGMGGIVASHLLGRHFDRRPTRAYAVVVTLGGAVGFALLSRTTSFPVLILLALTLLGGLAAAFPQLFALARVVLGDGPAGQRSAPLLRSGWSFAWAIGPLLGAALLTRYGFSGIFRAVAAVLMLTALIIWASPSPRLAPPTDAPVEPTPPTTPTEDVPSAIIGLLTISITLFFAAMIAGSVALPYFVTRDLHRPATAMGLLFSVCAAVEVVVAIGLVMVPTRVSQRWLIVGAMGVFVIYFAVTVLAQGMGLLLIGQLARGIGIAIVGAAGIRYFQDVMAPATGRATTLFANASTAGVLVAGVLAGASLQSFGYTTTLLLCGVAALIGALIFWLGTRSRATDR